MCALMELCNTCTHYPVRVPVQFSYGDLITEIQLMPVSAVRVYHGE